MEGAVTKKNPFVLPSLVATWKLPYSPQHGEDDHQFFDVQFCPYYSHGESDPIFAVVGCRDILLCGTRVNEDGIAEIYHVFRDQEATGSEGLPILNTCAWVYIDESNPLLAVSGPSGQIKVLEACSGSLFTIMTGHGAGLINDLATHPQYPWILASASIDSSIRIWDLRRWEETHESPCIVICGQGNGHKEGILSIAWHPSGRYIISGAHDNMVCLWTIPDLSGNSDFWSSISVEKRKSKSDAVHTVHYPHFITSAIHSDYVDCVCFFGDMILSKAASENKIVLWEVTDFDSRLPPPSPEQAPKTQEHKDTRNGFLKSRATGNGGVEDTRATKQSEDENKPLYIQHLEFDIADEDAIPFYMRFGLLTPSKSFPDLHTVLVCGNSKSRIFMWDFKRLEFGHADGYQPPLPDHRPKYEDYIDAKKKPHKKQVKAQAERHVSTPMCQTPGSQKSSTPQTVPESPASQPQTTPNRERYPISDPFTAVQAHKTITLPDFPRKETNTILRGVSWSPCGKWCVVVGDLESAPNSGIREAQGALLSRWM